jgi:hypothetical protein
MSFTSLNNMLRPRGIFFLLLLSHFNLFQGTVVVIVHEDPTMEVLNTFRERFYSLKEQPFRIAGEIRVQDTAKDMGFPDCSKMMDNFKFGVNGPTLHILVRKGAETVNVLFS